MVTVFNKQLFVLLFLTVFGSVEAGITQGAGTMQRGTPQGMLPPVKTDPYAAFKAETQDFFAIITSLSQNFSALVDAIDNGEKKRAQELLGLMQKLMTQGMAQLSAFEKRLSDGKNTAVNARWLDLKREEIKLWHDLCEQKKGEIRSISRIKSLPGYKTVKKAWGDRKIDKNGKDTSNGKDASKRSTW